MSKSMKARKADKVKITPRKKIKVAYEEEEVDRVINKVLKQKNNLKDFDKYLDE